LSRVAMLGKGGNQEEKKGNKNDRVKHGSLRRKGGGKALAEVVRGEMLRSSKKMAKEGGKKKSGWKPVLTRAPREE